MENKILIDKNGVANISNISRKIILLVSFIKKELKWSLFPNSRNKDKAYSSVLGVNPQTRGNAAQRIGGEISSFQHDEIEKILNDRNFTMPDQ